MAISKVGANNNTPKPQAAKPAPKANETAKAAASQVKETKTAAPKPKSDSVSISKESKEAASEESSGGLNLSALKENYSDTKKSDNDSKVNAGSKELGSLIGAEEEPEPIVIRGTQGNDDIKLSQNEDGSVVLNMNGEDKTYSAEEAERLLFELGEGNNSLSANEGYMYGLNVNAGNGNNTIVGGSGNDQINVGNGNNNIDGGFGSDKITAGNGNNTIAAGEGGGLLPTGSEMASLGNGVNFPVSTGMIRLGDDIHVGDGNNTITGGNGEDRITAGNGNNVIYGNEGNDKIKVGAGSNIVDGGAGDDRIIAGNHPRLGGGSNNNATNALLGGDGDDKITAYGGNNFVDGEAGNDTIRTGSGNDIIFGGSGADKIDSGKGNDVVNYGAIGENNSKIGENTFSASQIDPKNIATQGLNGDVTQVSDELKQYYANLGQEIRYEEHEPYGSIPLIERQDSNGNKFEINANMGPDFDRLMAAAAEEGVQIVLDYPADCAYRSRDRQQYLLDTLGSGLAAQPGSQWSNHEQGMALDISVVGGGREFLTNHASEFNFESYKDAYGGDHEPWHFNYNGNQV